jgi:TonB family protein
MKSNSLCRLLLSFGLFMALAREANAEAQVGGVSATVGPAERSVSMQIVEVRGDTPYVEVNGKEVAVPLDSIKFFPSNGPFPLFGKIPPSWVFASNFAVHRVTLNGKTDTALVSGFNKQLQFSVDLESPTLLDKVWVIVTLADDNGHRMTLLQGVGTLRPFKPATVAIQKRLFQDLYDNPDVDWRVFSHGREVFHSLMRSDTIEAEFTGIVTRVRQGVAEAEVEPYLTFPPRESSKAKNPVKFDLEIDRRGSVKTAAVAGGSDPAVEKSLLDAVKHWRFLPKREGNRSIDCRASVMVDLPNWKTWSNGCVTLASPSVSSSPVQRDRRISVSINPQEQSGSGGTAARTGVALPVAVYQVLPEFPEKIAAQGIEGKATVEFSVKPDGTVEGAKVASQTFELFGVVAVECVKQWKFRPAFRDGVPVGIRMWVPIVFTFSGCVPTSPFDGFYDQASLNKQYLPKSRGQELVELVAGLKYPLSLSEFYTALGSPNGPIGVLRQLTFDDPTHIAYYQLNAVGAPEEEGYTLAVYYTPNAQGSFANPRVKRAEVALGPPMPVPDFQIEGAPAESSPP